MPSAITAKFSEVNNAIDNAHSQSLTLASQFITDTPRDAVMRAHVYFKWVTATVVTGRDEPSMQDEVRHQWNQPALDWPAKANEIINATTAVTAWIEANFPLVRTSLNAAMNAAGTAAAMQNAIRNQMANDLDYLLTHKVVAGEITSPTIPAAGLAPLVALLNTVATVTTI